MAETTGTPPADGNQAAQTSLQIRAQILRNLSFSNPGALKRFDPSPQVTVNINVDAGKGEDNHFMVGLRIEAAAKAGEETVYDIKVDYAGLFRLVNVEQRSLEPVLLIECPAIRQQQKAEAGQNGGGQPVPS